MNKYLEKIAISIPQGAKNLRAAYNGNQFINLKPSVLRGITGMGHIPEGTDELTKMKIVREAYKGKLSRVKKTYENPRGLRRYGGPNEKVREKRDLKDTDYHTHAVPKYVAEAKHDYGTMLRKPNLPK